MSSFAAKAALLLVCGVLAAGLKNEFGYCIDG